MFSNFSLRRLLVFFVLISTVQPAVHSLGWDTLGGFLWEKAQDKLFSESQEEESDDEITIKKGLIKEWMKTWGIQYIGFVALRFISECLMRNGKSEHKNFSDLEWSEILGNVIENWRSVVTVLTGLGYEEATNDFNSDDSDSHYRIGNFSISKWELVVNVAVFVYLQYSFLSKCDLKKSGKKKKSVTTQLPKMPTKFSLQVE